MSSFILQYASMPSLCITCPAQGEAVTLGSYVAGAESSSQIWEAVFQINNNTGAAGVAFVNRYVTPNLSLAATSNTQPLTALPYSFNSSNLDEWTMLNQANDLFWIASPFAMPATTFYSFAPILQNNATPGPGTQLGLTNTQSASSNWNLVLLV